MRASTFLRWPAALVLVALALGGARAGNLERLEALGLPTETGALTLHYSPSAQGVAVAYAADISAGVAWYRDRLAWAGAVTVAVLDEADFARVTGIPYPSPHMEPQSGLIIIADRIDSHPGFELWDLAATPLNTAWALHEVGHLVARDLGITATSSWINELIANVVMAGYVRAERPDLAGFQSGLPPRFADAGRYRRLAEFDTLYFSMGQFNYLWFQFQIARIADYLAADTDFTTLIAGFGREFPAAAPRRRLPPDAALQRLERIRPGVTAFADALFGE